jgi:hypothetical protein
VVAAVAVAEVVDLAVVSVFGLPFLFKVKIYLECTLTPRFCKP